MDEFKPNSLKSKEGLTETKPKKHIEKVITGKVKTKKKNDIQKIADVFISEDVDNVKSYIIMDVLVPSIKKAISDIVTNGIDMVLYGGTGVNRNKSISSKISYRNYYDREEDRRNYNNVINRTRNGYDYDDIILDTRGEAEEVILRMEEAIATYGIVSVADLYDLVGVTGNYTDNKYGWSDIRSAQPVRVREGYLIKLPRALPLN